jgi:hypothetical protein
MKAMLIPVGWNELLDFVRRCHSVLPEPALSILSFNSPTAAWRFIPSKNQLSKLREAQSIPDESAFKRNFDAPDLCRLTETLSLNHSTEI